MLIKLNLQRFAVPIGVSLNVTLDSGIESIHITTPYEAVNTITSNGTYGSFNNKITTFVVTLKNGYIMDKMLVGTSEVTATSENTYEYTFNIDEIAVSFTSKKATSQVSIDLTTLSGWGNVADGQHSIQVVAKADGYKDSEKSTAVSFTKGTATDELAGTWVFNEQLNTTTLATTYVNFTSNGKTCSSIRRDYSSRPFIQDAVLYDFDGYERQVYDTGGWANAGYKTITITSKLSEVTNGSELLAWLQANAVKQ